MASEGGDDWMLFWAEGRSKVKENRQMVLCDQVCVNS